MTEQLHLAVALDGYGWHPQAWRHTPETEPVTSGRYWSRLATTAERGLLDFVTFDDALTAQRRRRPEIEPRWLAGRPDAVLVASRVAPATKHIGLIPVATVTHTEPFHVSKAIATLDFVSHARAGWQVRVSGTPHEADLFGRRDIRGADLFDEAADAVEVARRLWDSWEDDAVIRDVATGRFVDRDKLHYIDFAGKYFSVKGPSITPRPPQGQPVVAALAHAKPIYEFAVRSTDLVFITPQDDDSLRAILAEVAGLKVYADLYVTFSRIVDARSDALVFDGTQPNSWSCCCVGGSTASTACGCGPRSTPPICPSSSMRWCRRYSRQGASALLTPTARHCAPGSDYLSPKTAMRGRDERSTVDPRPGPDQRRRRCGDRAAQHRRPRPARRTVGLQALLDRRTPLRRRRQLVTRGVDRSDRRRHRTDSRRRCRGATRPDDGRRCRRELRDARGIPPRPHRPRRRPLRP